MCGLCFNQSHLFSHKYISNFSGELKWQFDNKPEILGNKQHHITAELFLSRIHPHIEYEMRYAITFSKFSMVIHFSSSITFTKTYSRAAHNTWVEYTFNRARECRNWWITQNGQTELNLYCQSKIIRLENQNTKPNLAFNEWFFLSLCRFSFSLSFSAWILFLTLFLALLSITSTLSSFLCFFPSRSVRAFDLLVQCVCRFSSNGSHFLINFRTFVFIYLADYFYCCRFASPMHSFSIEFQIYFPIL